MSPNKDETAVLGMRKVLARPWGCGRVCPLLFSFVNFLCTFKARFHYSKSSCLFGTQLVYFRSFSFVYILHICVFLNQNVCHSCLLGFAAAQINRMSTSNTPYSQLSLLLTPSGLGFAVRNTGCEKKIFDNILTVRG